MTPVPIDRARRFLRTRVLRAPGATDRSEGQLRASEERLRAALLAGRTVAWEWDLRSDRIIRSENAPALIGLPVEAEARRGQAFAEFIHPDDRERVKAAVERSLATRTSVAAEFRLVRPDGAVLWVVDDGQFEMDARGQPLRMRGIIRDITERKLLEERLAFVTDRAPVLIAQIDTQERYVFINRPYAERYGGRAADLLGRRVRDVVGAESYAGLEGRLRAALTGSGELTWESAEGGQHFQFRAVVDREPGGQVRGLLLVATDITQRRNAEAQRESARAYAESANRAKDEFLATLSHELRTPMHAILGWARMLASGRLDADTARRAVDVIQRNAEAQAQLVDDLLDVARITSGKMRLDLRPLDPVSVIERALEVVQTPAEVKEISLESALDPRAGPVMGDPERLQQVVWNLLTNAVKFTGRGGRVQVSLTRRDSHLELRVTDTGAGISPAFLPHVFERFTEGHGGTRAHRGLGIGLALVKHLVEQHGGSVWADSPGEGQGATFGVRLPLMIGEGPPAAPRAHVGVAWPMPFDLPVSLRDIKLLVVDDEPDALGLLAELLRRAGAEVRTARSAREALAMLDPWPPDVLVSDIEMPEQDGYELIRQVRASSSEQRRLPAVAVTAYARSEDRVRALAAGYTSHIAKPIDAVELVTVIGALAGRLRP